VVVDFNLAVSVIPHSRAHSPPMNDHASIAKFTAFVQLKDFRGPTKKEYVRYVRQLGDHYRCDPATLTEDQVRAYYLELRQVRKFGASGMKVAKCALRAIFQERILALLDWKSPVRVTPAPLPPPQCPACGKTMFLIGTLPRAPTPRRWRLKE